MKAREVITGFLRIFVGITFIISGFIKLNDPVGFSFKLEEYFQSDVLNMEFLQPFALGMAVVLVVVEILLGIMLIIGFLKKFTLWALILMIGFFTFLTFYSAYFEKVTDCGCFGDALPLTPWQSFWKDIILTVMILFLFFNQKFIKPFFSFRQNGIMTTIVTIACLWFGQHVLMHLPAIDFRAYKVGTHIPTAMTPDPTQPAVYEYDYKFDKNGEEIIVTTNGEYPSPVPGKFISYESRLVDEGYVPPIHDFMISDEEDNNLTKTLLAKPKTLLILSYDLDKSESRGWMATRDAIQAATSAGYEVIGLSASMYDDLQEKNKEYEFNINWLTNDLVGLKTMIRSNPGFVILEQGVITDKKHWNDASDLKFN